jgi:hypothetical protein
MKHRTKDNIENTPELVTNLDERPLLLELHCNDLVKLHLYADCDSSGCLMIVFREQLLNITMILQLDSDFPNEMKENFYLTGVMLDTCSLTNQMALVVKQLLARPEHMSSSPVLDYVSDACS